jgi:hypothetical protein
LVKFVPMFLFHCFLWSMFFARFRRSHGGTKEKQGNPIRGYLAVQPSFNTS